MKQVRQNMPHPVPGTSRIVLFLLLFCGMLTALSGCAWYPSGAQSTENPPDSVVAALPAKRQDKSVQPKLVFIPRDDAFAIWWTGTVSDGWVGAGQHYAGSQGMMARIDYYDQAGQLRWTYRGAASAINSENYLCAARRPDGTLVVGGRHSDGADPEQASVTAFNVAGEILWSTLIDYPADKNIGLSAAQCLITSDNRILVLINTDLYNVTSGNQPSIMACLDENGNLLWQTSLDFGGMTYNNHAVLDDTDGLYMALYGYARTGGQLSAEYNWLVRIDREGREIWRQPLADKTYQYQVSSLARDSEGFLYLSCSARYIGATPTPTMPAQFTDVFHDRYRSMAWNPAVLLEVDRDGQIVWKKFLNGEFGASGGQVYCDGQTVYWRITLVDDIVPPYIFMSIDHRSISHQVLAVLKPQSQDFLFRQFSKEESGDQMVQRIENGQPVLIGIEPFIPPKEWETETFIPGKG